MKNKLLSVGRVYKNTPIIDGGTLFDMLIEAPEAASEAKPGQIVHVDCGKDTSLRRPISICEVVGDMLRLCYDVRGRGTRAMAEMEPGDEISILGPLGSGFVIPEEGRVLLVGGGIGIYPLVSAASVLGERAVALLGFRNKTLVNSTGLFEAHSTAVRICTDDGSYGTHGFVTALLEEELQKESATVIMCGPMGMMRACAGICEKYNAPAYASLEERMGCGVGACLACVTKVKHPMGAHGTHVECCDGTKADAPAGEYLARVCVDGPVFDAKEIIW